MTRRFRPASVVLLAALGAACATPVASGIGVTVELDEYHVDVSAGVVVAGRHTFFVASAGDEPHQLVLETVDGAIVASTGVLGPHDAAELEIADLAPGAYTLTCRIVTRDGATLVDHFARGMRTTLTVAAK